MICNCGSLFGLYRVKAGWAGICKKCGRRHTIDKPKQKKKQIKHYLEYLDVIHYHEETVTNRGSQA